MMHRMQRVATGLAGLALGAWAGTAMDHGAALIAELIRGPEDRA